MLKIILFISTLVISIVSTVDFCYSLNSKCNKTQIYKCGQNIYMLNWCCLL